MSKMTELDKAAKAVAAGAVTFVGTLTGGLATAAAASHGNLGAWAIVAVVITSLGTTVGATAGVYVTTNAPSSPAPTSTGGVVPAPAPVVLTPADLPLSTPPAA